MEIKHRNEIFKVLFINMIKDNKIQYFLYYQKSFNTKKYIDGIVNFLNKKEEVISRWYRLLVLDKNLLILDKEIYIVFYKNTNIFTFLKLLEKCKLTDIYYKNIGINITSFINKDIKNLFIEYWNNYEIRILIFCNALSQKDTFHIDRVYKIVKFNNIIYKKQITEKEIKDKINDFEKRLNKYLFRK